MFTQHWGPWTVSAHRQLPAKNPPYIDILILAVHRQDPPWHGLGGFSTFCSMVTQNRDSQTISTNRQLQPKSLRYIDTSTQALNCLPRSTVTWGVFNVLLPGHGQTQAVAHQDPPLYRHLDPGNCTPRSSVTWGVFNILLHDHPKNRVQWVFPFPAHNIFPTSPWPRRECHTSPTTLQVSYVD